MILNANDSNALKISIDVPNGMFLSEVTPQNAIVFKANHTLTFQCPKLNFFLPDFGNYVGKLTILDIGLDADAISKIETQIHYVDHHITSKIVKSRERFTHKGNYGHTLIVGGQFGMMGSVCLTAKSALKSGAGKVSVLSPKCGIEILQISIPEAMVITSENKKTVSPVKLDFEPNAICIGMGIGKTSETLETLKYFINQTNNPLLIDADGLNLLSDNLDLLDKLPKNSILTPHQGELKKLIGEWHDQYDKLEKLKAFSKKYQVIVVSKDAYTIIVNGKELYINSTGNAGMATAGSGDTLSGIIAGLMSQNYLPLEASILGVFLHGCSADYYANKFNESTLTASDIIENLKNVF